jgi:hypothetical protein
MHYITHVQPCHLTWFPLKNLTSGIATVFKQAIISTLNDFYSYDIQSLSRAMIRILDYFCNYDIQWFHNGSATIFKQGIISALGVILQVDRWGRLNLAAGS